MKSPSRVPHLATPWTAAYQAPPTMGFSRQEYWSGVPLPSLEVALTAPFLAIIPEGMQTLTASPLPFIKCMYSSEGDPAGAARVTESRASPASRQRQSQKGKPPPSSCELGPWSTQNVELTFKTHTLFGDHRKQPRKLLPHFRKEGLMTVLSLGPIHRQSVCYLSHVLENATKAQVAQW